MEGFDLRHISKAYRETRKKKVGTDKERVYEDALQYLCIHLKEDQLPVGFDPLGGTLDVILPAKGGGIGGVTLKDKNGEVSKGVRDGGNGTSAHAGSVNNNCYNSVHRFADYFGLTHREASAIIPSLANHTSLEKMERLDGEWMRERRAFWKVLTNAAYPAHQKDLLSRRIDVR